MITLALSRKSTDSLVGRRLRTDEQARGTCTSEPTFTVRAGVVFLRTTPRARAGRGADMTVRTHKHSLIKNGNGLFVIYNNPV